MLSVVQRVVTWTDYDVRRTRRIELVFTGFRHARELVPGLHFGVNEFPGAPDFFAGLQVSLGVSMPPLMTLRHFLEATQSWLIYAPSVASGRTDAMSEKAVLVDRLGNME